MWNNASLNLAPIKRGFNHKDKKVSANTANRPYECVIIVKPEATEEKQKNLFKKNKQIIESFKGELTHVETWGRRRLANPIKKEKAGLYFHTLFTANPQSIAELERTMRINEDVLRFVHVRLDDRTDLNKHLEAFKENIAQAQQRDRERFAEKQAARNKREMKPSI